MIEIERRAIQWKLPLAATAFFAAMSARRTCRRGRRWGASASSILRWSSGPSTATSSRDNIHTFQAGPKGARGIDINTPAGRDIGFSFLDIAPKPLDVARATFSARWLGQTPPTR